MEPSDQLPKHYTLQQLNRSIENHIAKIARSIWITAEVASVGMHGGHAYLELVQKEGDDIVAKAKAVAWFTQLSMLRRKLGEEQLAALLRPGTKVLLLIMVSFHSVHGLSLQVMDLDPAYTLGELELRRQQTIGRLQTEGLLALQQRLRMPLVVQRLAVLSSPKAAGYADFLQQLRGNAYGYGFLIDLYPVSVQGDRALSDMMAQLQAIDFSRYDALVVIRGGGGKLDLEAFNDYGLCAALARLPLPVLTGIGHQTDECVADLVAAQPLRTPTAVAEFLIHRALQYEGRLQLLLDQSCQRAARRLQRYAELLQLRQQQLGMAMREHLFRQQTLLDRRQLQLQMALRQRLQQEGQRLDMLAWKVAQLDPSVLFQKGYTLTLKDGRPLPGQQLQPGDVLVTLGQDLRIESTVTKIS